MVTKTIQYHDLDGDLREDTFYFAMNETQYARINRQFPGGLQAFASKAAKDKNADDMFLVIDTLVRESYGERINESFVKVTPNGQKLSDFFVNTEAYDNLLIELMQSEDTLLAFMTNCLNQNARERIAGRMAEEKAQGKSGDKPSLTLVDGDK